MIQRLLTATLLVLACAAATAIADTAAPTRLRSSAALESLPPEAALDSGLGGLRPATPSEPLIAELIDSFDESQRIPTIDLTVAPSDLWQRIRNGFAMPDLSHPLVTKQQAWYLNRPAALRISLERSRRYLFHIVEELEKRGMPTELALLPVIESSFNPQAHSPARALGMWQFIPSTGKNYNLKQNWWLDERRDILASTEAALDYLQTIYEMHGDWQLALASYNWGEGAVGRAVGKNAAKGLPTEYSALKMPNETRWYVPKLQAVKNIVANPALYGVDLPPIPNEAYFGTVDVATNVDVDIAAQLAEIPLTEFIALNPAYSRPVIPGSSDNPLVLPADKVQTFLENLAAHEQADRPLSRWHTYTLGGKDSIDSVAKRFGVSASYLRRINAISKRNPARSGSALLIPGKDVAQVEHLAAVLPKTPEAVSRKRGKAKSAKAATPRSKAVASTAAGKSKPAGKVVTKARAR